MRLLVARCSVTYEGRLGARLAPAIRLVLCKADGSIAIHSDAKAYKPLNWMNPPCTIEESDGVIVARTPKGETLRIELHEILHDTTFELGDDPGLEKDGVEAELQQLIAARVAALRTDLTLVRREFPTDIGPDRSPVSRRRRARGRGRGEARRRHRRRRPTPALPGTARPRSRSSRRPSGMFVAQQIKPQAKVYAESKGVACVEIDLERLRGDVDPDLTLF